jgi:hypothetical protein
VSPGQIAGASYEELEMAPMDVIYVRFSESQNGVKLGMSIYYKMSPGLTLTLQFYLDLFQFP